MKKKTVSRFVSVFTFNRLLLLLVLASFAVRVAYLNAGIFHFDEVSLVEAVEKTHETGILQPMANYRYGHVAVNSLLFLLLRPFGASAEWSVRFASALFGALSVLMLVLLARRLFKDDFIALSSGLLLSASPVFLSLSTFGKEHTLSSFLLLLAFYLTMRYHDERRWWLAALASASMGLSLTVRESGLILAPLFFMLYLGPALRLPELFARRMGRKGWIAAIRTDRRLTLRHLAAGILPFIAITSLIMVSYMGEMVAYTLTQKGTGIVYFKGIASQMLPHAYLELMKTLTPAGLILLVFGMLSGWLARQRRFVQLWLVAWALSFLYFANTSGYNSRFLAEPLPGMVMLIAVGASTLAMRNRLLGIGAALLTATLMFATIYPVISYRHQHNGLKELGMELERSTEPDALVIAMDETPFIQRYGHRKTLGHPILPTDAELKAWFKELDALLANGTQLYALVAVPDAGDRRMPQISGYDYDGTIFETMSHWYSLVEVGKIRTEDFHRTAIELLPYDLNIMRVTPPPEPVNTSAAPSHSTG